jgi:glycosyltransferase involved in cell wall biosynthesis
MVHVSRILLHSHTFSPDAVSTGYIMTDLARQLHKFGHDITVLTTTPHYNLEPAALARQPLRRSMMGLVYRSEIDGVHVWHVKVPMKGKRLYSRVFDILWFHLLSLVLGWTAVGPFDIVITPSPPITIGVVGWLIAARRHAPAVYNVQEIYPDFAVNQGLIRSPLIIGILSRIERLVYDRSAAVVTISEWFSRIIRPRGLTGGKLRTIPNSVDTDLFHPLPRGNAFAREHGLIDDFIVLYGGNIGPGQDWESVLYAAESLRDLPIQFVVVGGGAKASWLEEECSRRQLKNVRLLGYQSRSLMPLVNASADLCIIPMKAGTTRDGFPSKIYTIMASGKSVLVQADEDSELAWLVRHTLAGRVVRPGDPGAYAAAVRTAYEERSLLPGEGMRGREYVQTKYSVHAVGQAYDALVRELTDRRH